MMGAALVGMNEHDLVVYRLSSKERELRGPSYISRQLSLNGLKMSHSPRDMAFYSRLCAGK